MSCAAGATTGATIIESPELRRVVRAWGKLATPLKAAILAIVDSTVRGNDLTGK